MTVVLKDDFWVDVMVTDSVDHSAEQKAASRVVLKDDLWVEMMVTFLVDHSADQ